MSTRQESDGYFSEHGAADVLPVIGMHEELLTVAQAADVLKVSPITIRRMLERGELKAIPIGGRGGRLLRIDRAELDRALRSWAEAVTA